MSTAMTTRGRVAFEEYARVLVENGGRRIEWENLTHHQRLGWQCAAHSIAETVTVGEAEMNESSRKHERLVDDIEDTVANQHRQTVEAE